MPCQEDSCPTARQSQVHAAKKSTYIDITAKVNTGNSNTLSTVSKGLKVEAALHIRYTLFWPTRQRAEPGLQTREMLRALLWDPAEPVLIRGN